MTTLVEPLRPVDVIAAPEISAAAGKGGLKNAPYLLPHVRALRPTSAIHYGSCQGKLIELLRHTGITRVVRYDPNVPALSRRPRGFYDLLLSVDLLEHIPENNIDVVLAEMAALAREAIIVIDTRQPVAKDGVVPQMTVRSHDWWQTRLRSHFAYVEPIRVRSRRRAAFKTWPTRRGSRPKLWLKFLGEELRYRLAKLGFKPS